nr:MAG TPA: hypothetical protein [Caudoviricetes sp.]
MLFFVRTLYIFIRTLSIVFCSSKELFLLLYIFCGAIM